MTPAETAALRALRDCGAIRAPSQHPGFRGLRSRGLAFTKVVPGTHDLIFTLSTMGKDRTRALPPLPHERPLP